MKSLWKVVSLIILLAAIGGTAYLVKRSQETRKSADVGNASMTLLPSTQSVKVGDVVTLHLYADSGAATDTMTGIQVYIKYDNTKIQLLSAAEGGATSKLNGYALLNNGSADVGHWVDLGSGNMEIKMLNGSLTGEPPYVGGSHNFLDLKFKALAAGDASVNIVANKWDEVERKTLMNIVTGGNWIVEKRNNAVITIGTGGATEVPAECTSNSTCSDDKKCENGKCVALNCDAAPSDLTCKNTSTNAHACPTYTNKADGSVCASGKTCSNGVCTTTTTENECNANSDCSADKKCYGGKCVTPTCDAPPELSCKNVVHHDHACDSYTNKTDGSDCGGGKVCKSGVCAAQDGKVMNFKLSFAGVSQKSQCANDWKVDVMVKGNGWTKEFASVPLTVATTGETKNVYLGSVVLGSEAKTTSGLSIFVKGPKHVQVKYGKDGQAEMYNVDGGELSIDDQSKVYDFTNYPMAAGDVNKDGVINGVDFSVVLNKVISHADVSGTGAAEDLDGSCAMTTNDILLLREALQEKQDQIY